MLGTGAQSNFMLKKQNAENKQLKTVISRLCDKLKDYQKQFISNKSSLAEEQAQIDAIGNKPQSERGAGVVLAADDEDPADGFDDGFAQLMGGHTIGPLV